MRAWRTIACAVAVGLWIQWGVAAPSDPFHVSASLAVERTSGVVTVTFAVPPRHHLYADEIHVRDTGGGTLNAVEMDRPTRIHDPFSEADRDAYTNDFALVYHAGAWVVTGLTLEVEYQGCNEVTCFFPQRRRFALVPGGAPLTEPLPARPSPALVTGTNAWKVVDGEMRVRGRGYGFLRPKEFLAFLDQSEQGNAGLPQRKSGFGNRLGDALALFSSSPTAFLERFGVTWTLLLILIGGFLLNLTPCVLPMIPVNLAILGVGTQGRSRLRGFAIGSAYGCGIAVAYGLLGLAVVLAGAQFGTLNSLPAFNAVMAVVFVLLGLAMFDVIQIDLTRFQGGAGSGGTSSGSCLTAVAMGGVAALLAGACVAPVVIAVLVLSGNLYAGGTTLGLALPFVLGVGMALPWPAAGAGLSFLPKPGGWMTWVKYGFGVFILVLACYYGWIAVQGWRGPRVASDAQAGLIRLSADQGASEWDAVVQRAKREAKPVLVDFWATWCKNCEAMDAGTFRDARVRKRLEGFIVVKCQAERVRDATTRETLDHFGVKGLPTYLVLEPMDLQEGRP